MFLCFCTILCPSLSRDYSQKYQCWPILCSLHFLHLPHNDSHWIPSSLCISQWYAPTSDSLLNSRPHLQHLLNTSSHLTDILPVAHWLLKFWLTKTELMWQKEPFCITLRKILVWFSWEQELVADWDPAGLYVEAKGDFIWLEEEYEIGNKAWHGLKAAKLYLLLCLALNVASWSSWSLHRSRHW